MAAKKIEQELNENAFDIKVLQDKDGYFWEIVHMMTREVLAYSMRSFPSPNAALDDAKDALNQ